MAGVKIKREIDLSNLPKLKINDDKLHIDWANSIGHEVEGIYDDIRFSIKIIDFERNKKRYLTIIYNNKEIDISTKNFQNCHFGKIFGKIVNGFRYEIGARFKNDKRDITIIDRKIVQEENIDKLGRKSIANKKYYKYKCNKCGFDGGEHWSVKDKEYKEELWILETSIKSGRGCSCCCPNSLIVVQGINDIITTDKWLIPIINDDEFCKTHTRSSGDEIYPTCPDCGRIKDKKMRINDIYRYHSIRCSCSDKIPYTEKLIFNILEQLNVEFQTQLNKSTFKWCENYRYDFYFELNEEQYVLEANGEQHYEKSFSTIKGAKTLEEEIENDRIKKELALSNGIQEENYIVIDCRKSELEFIKQNILNSILNELFDLSTIDWLKAEEFTCSNLIKEICTIKKNNPDLTTTEIGKLIKGKHSSGTIQKWLKQGSKLGWCDYNANEERKKNKGGSNSIQIKVFKDNKLVGVFKSISELERSSKEKLGTKLWGVGVSKVKSNKWKQYKGFTFEYTA